MNSESEDMTYEVLQGIAKTYRGVFVDSDGELIGFNSVKWKTRYEPDYVLEIVLTCLSMVNLVCERSLDDDLRTLDDGDNMPDYDMGYRLFEDCSRVINSLNEFDKPVRESLITELFYSHVQYFNISNTAGRQGWYDVNKRLHGSILQLIEYQPWIVDLIDQWVHDVEDLIDQPSVDTTKEETWKAEFINSLSKVD